MNCNRRARTTAERIMCQYDAHLGPVQALHRHPQLPKIFLTVGDWTTHVWTEDIRDSPILTLKYGTSSSSNMLSHHRSSFSV